MTCQYCNHANPEGTLFCEECKAFLPDAVDVRPEPVVKPITDTPPPFLTASGGPLPFSGIPSMNGASPSAPSSNGASSNGASSNGASSSVPSSNAGPSRGVSSGPTSSSAPPPLPAFPDNDSPFGDFQPAWMNPAAAKPAPARQNRPVPPAPAASLSIEALLQEPASPKPGSLIGENAGPAPAAPAWPAAFTYPRPETEPLADPTQGLPVPAFQVPPLWFKPVIEIPWQEVKTGEAARSVPSNSIGNGYNSTLSGPETLEPAPPEPATGPEYGVDRGFYFFMDPHGNVVLHALAGFGRRLAGAIVDSIISAILGVIFFYLVVVLFLNLNSRNYTQSVLGIVLAAAILPVLFGFLYHTILVGLTGQTLGHRFMGIKVIRRGGRAVGLVSGIVRALYGLVPTFAAIILSLIFPSDAANTNLTASLLSLAIGALIALGMAWALFDQAHQGLHDKLADTYVVSVKES